MSRNLLKEHLEDLAAFREEQKNRQKKRNRKAFTHTGVQNTGFLTALKARANLTRTENGALTLRSSGAVVLDFFACVGALRDINDSEILRRFFRAWAEEPDIALKILFYARDVRGGLGERRVFRLILHELAEQEPNSIRRNIPLIPFYGRYDDLLVLLGTPCEKDVVDLIRKDLDQDMASLASGGSVSLAAKWLPSINASSEETRQQALAVARSLGMSSAEYRKTLSALRSAARILENNLRKKDYSFMYSAQPSKAMFKYQKAFQRNDRKRYNFYLDQVKRGKAVMHTSSLMPYELVHKAMYTHGKAMNDDIRKSLDIMWNALEDFTDGRNALAVIDGSGSMYWSGKPLPIEIAISLGMYFAERNTGMFHDHFITFSENPQLVEIQGRDFTDRVRYCMTYNECANTNIQAVFELILETAVKNGLPQSELPETIYIISDMEFDSCTECADTTNFEYVKKLFARSGYRLPNLVFWNVQSRNQQLPVRKDELGVALVSGASARLFSMAMSNEMDPITFMMQIIGSERYAPIHA